MRHFSPARTDADMTITSIYPVFPVPEDLSSEVNLDATHSDFLRIENGPEGYAPDVLILPSKFKQFAKVCPTFCHSSSIS